MLILPPSGLETAAERAFFTELGSWDTGGSVRGALVASLALSDGPMDRRICDAVVLVPEGIAVVRVVEVVRQSGVVTVLPEGSWTIGPGAGPGDVLRLAGGGSTPLDGLMRAGMEAAVRLRRAGLEPGRIARLTVLHGELTGLVPADGDLGEGDQVALLESRSLLLGIARAGRYAGTDNPRLWTTADVRAALEALGVRGRSPAVEELNGEGFPYSPYVLRRRELLAPATLASQPAVRTAAPTATPTGVQPAVTPLVPDWPATGPGSSGAPVGGPNGPLVDPAAAAALAAAAVAAEQAPAPRPAHDTVSLTGGPSTGAAPTQREQEPEPAWHETQAIVPRSAPPAEVDQTDGIGGIFADDPHPPRQEEHRPPAWATAARRRRPSASDPAGPGAACWSCWARWCWSCCSASAGSCSPAAGPTTTPRHPRSPPPPRRPRPRPARRRRPACRSAPRRWSATPSTPSRWSPTTSAAGATPTVRSPASSAPPTASGCPGRCGRPRSTACPRSCRWPG
ncbi:hypothetical protein ACFQX8_01400 [Klenkia terrae]|uniref:hypothetical protein n=1 Tax=Klenkia terrae TaxID=1052259 RepID=UPI00360C378A